MMGVPHTLSDGKQWRTPAKIVLIYEGGDATEFTLAMPPNCHRITFTCDYNAVTGLTYDCHAGGEPQPTERKT